MPLCFFVSDLHGKKDRYNKLFREIEMNKPSSVFLGGDLLPSGMYSYTNDPDYANNFVRDILIEGFVKLRAKLKDDYPRVFVILGNDDGKSEESEIINAESTGIWEYVHNKKSRNGIYTIYGYSYIPPTPFLLKDWERYDVSRYVDPGCVPPEEGWHSDKVNKDVIVYSTIKEDLEELTKNNNISNSIFLFHTPPYQTKLDRAALDGKMFEHVPLDLHIGSIAVKRFIEEKQPLITLHGHVHESPRLTGSWKERIGRTYAFSAAHDGYELALVKFDPENPGKAIRELI
jgi:Icc-related predicted phosphoesterase